MGGRAVSTIGSHAAAVKQIVMNCVQIRKTPTLPARGPMSLADHLGMGIAVEMLFNFLTATLRLKGEAHIQFDYMRRPQATFTLTWESSPMGGEGKFHLCNRVHEGDCHILSYPAEVVWLVSLGRREQDGLCVPV
jgi:hypothetical protein